MYMNVYIYTLISIHLSYSRPLLYLLFNRILDIKFDVDFD